MGGQFMMISSDDESRKSFGMSPRIYVRLVSNIGSRYMVLMLEQKSRTDEEALQHVDLNRNVEALYA